MNFFKQLSEVGVQNLELKVVIKNEILSVIIIPEMKNSNMVPLTVSGTAEELDEGFFGVISAPLKKTAGLISNVEEFEKSMENKPAAATAKDKKTDEDSTEKETKVPASRKKAEPKPVVYKHQKYVDKILAIVDVEGYELTEENSSDLANAVNLLLVVDAENEVAVKWDEAIKNLTAKETEKEEPQVEEKVAEVKETVPAEEPKAEKAAVVKEKPAETKVEEKEKAKVTPPPAPEKEEKADDEFFDDDDLDLDFEDFFSK